VNNRAEVVGVVVGSISEGQSLNFAVPVSLLRDLIRSSIFPTSELDQIDRKRESVEGRFRDWIWPSDCTIRAAYQSRQFDQLEQLGFTFKLDPRVLEVLEVYRCAERPRMEICLYRSGQYMRLARTIFREEGIPENLVWIGQVVSCWNPESAAGLWGLNPEVGRTLGLTMSKYVNEFKGFEKATQATARYLKQLSSRYMGDWELAIAAYVTSTELVDGAIQGAGVASLWTIYRFLPSEKARMVPQILATILIANYPRALGFGFAFPDEQLRWETVLVPPTTNLIVVEQSTGTSLANLRKLNPELLTNFTPPYPYVIRVPPGKGAKLVRDFRK